MEKIERLAHLNPKTEEVAGHSLEMFRLLRSYAMMDWVLRHPNDLGQQRAEVKFEKLVERTWQLMDAMQSEIEGHQSNVIDVDPEGESLIVRANG
jgi:hypothetical protein